MAFATGGVTSEERESLRADYADRRLDGPWLFMDLPLGRYEVEAQFGDVVQRPEVTVHAGDHHKLVFYFDVPDNGAGPGR